MILSQTDIQKSDFYTVVVRGGLPGYFDEGAICEEIRQLILNLIDKEGYEMSCPTSSIAKQVRECLMKRYPIAEIKETPSCYMSDTDTPMERHLWTLRSPIDGSLIEFSIQKR